MNILFTGGGTGGHIIPGIAIAEEFRKRYKDVKLGFISRSGGNENELIKKADIPLYTLQIQGLKRRICKDNFRIVRNAFSAKSAAGKMIDEFLPDVVIGTGGYVCWPVISAAHEKGIPTVIHESNTSMGLTNKLLIGKTDLLLLGQNVTKHAAKGIFIGNPIREGFGKYTKQAAKRELGIPENKKLILSVGGSIGAEKLNKTVFELMNTFCSSNEEIYHIHSSGHRYYDSIPEAYKKYKKGFCGCKIMPFIENMPRALNAADLVISRCGSITLAELSFCKKPAILIPSPNVTANHQYKNAKYYEALGAATVIEEKDLTLDSLTAKISNLIFDENRLMEISVAIGNLSVPDSAKRIADIIEREFFNI